MPPLFLSLTAEYLIRLIYPAFCAVCPRLLTLSERHVCTACLERMNADGLPKNRKVLSHAIPGLSESFSLYAYRGAVKDLMTQFKFNESPWLLKVLRRPLGNFLLAVEPETRYDALAPVPMTLGRFLVRQYNPAEILAYEAGSLCRLPVIKALKKIRSTPPQHALSADDRRANLRGSFAVRNVRRVSGKNILLIDDILTTGSTALEAARALKLAGARRIGLLTLARTLEQAKTA